MQILPADPCIPVTVTTDQSIDTSNLQSVPNAAPASQHTWFGRFLKGGTHRQALYLANLLRVDVARMNSALKVPLTDWADPIKKKLEARKHLLEGMLASYSEFAELVVDESEIPNAGLGLYTTKDRKKGDVIEYCFGFLVYMYTRLIGYDSQKNNIYGCKEYYCTHQELQMYGVQLRGPDNSDDGADGARLNTRRIYSTILILLSSVC